MDSRLPAHLEVSGLVRAVQAAGGFATLIARGEPEAGTILVICCDRGDPAEVYERMPDASGGRKWTSIVQQAERDEAQMQAYLERRRRQDPDLWIVELDIPQAKRFIGMTNPAG